MDAELVGATEGPSGAHSGPPRDSARAWFERLLAGADIRVGGDRPWDLQLLDPDVPERVLAQGTLGLGESYMDGHWAAERLDQFFDKLVQAQTSRSGRPIALAAKPPLWHLLKARLLNLQTQSRAWQVGQQHYDLGNDFYAAMLDPRMTYTCAYWGGGAETLDEAQEAKLELVCRKLMLQPGMRVLDIGCGWGSLMKYAAERFGVQCVGVTVSAEQVALGRELCAGLPIEFRLQDYRGLIDKVDELGGHFDRVVSLGMFEHVGHKNYAAFMRVAETALKPDGLFLLHTIGRNEHGNGTDPWIDRYIFPNGELPTIARIGRVCERRFVVEDLHNFGADYDRTLMSWHANVEAAWPRFAETLGERFRRMWTYYLLSCAGAFRARDIQLWQWVLSPRGVPGGYHRPA
ncbi:MAG TPA: cyclopropane fatty acyl phospholipid synthase [Ideonella sp.]|uniref:cyclopropane fatty acyl phospholipid synthase n=1 Tax=Ideonella sp. TaxID=1929293 RepID=UPI002E372A45|nr:cyclopropane fatty acyl phospholipid synthase [Ideonella sp.]HEX5682908.1 cyclopropane fatty acyl phospholipid synthase [Ideonella sp.]